MGVQNRLDVIGSARVTETCGHTSSSSVAVERRPAAGPFSPAQPAVLAAPGVRQPSQPLWYCVETYPQQVAEVRARLVAQGFDVFLPLGAKRLWSGVYVGPLFGHYLFVRFDVRKHAWRRICSTRGVRRIFGSTPETPCPVRPEHMRLIQALPVRGLETLGAEVDGPAEIGQPFRIVSGPWRGSMGLCLDIVGGGVRALAFLRAGLGEVELPARWCRRA